MTGNSGVFSFYMITTTTQLFENVGMFGNAEGKWLEEILMGDGGGKKDSRIFEGGGQNINCEANNFF